MEKLVVVIKRVPVKNFNGYLGRFKQKIDSPVSNHLRSISFGF